MDLTLVYRSPSGEERPVESYELDLDIGYGKKNDFELKTSFPSDFLMEAGGLIYVEGTDIGGVINTVNSDTFAGEIRYTGLTWSGILMKHIICPPSGSDYKQVSSTATGVIANIISAVGLTDLFSRGEPNTTSIDVTSDRFCDAYTGLLEAMADNDLKLSMYFDSDQNKVIYTCKTIESYVEQSEFDTSVAKIEVKYCKRPVNHLICLGKGELSSRWVIHLYADANGNLSTTQTLTGVDEIAAVYDYSNTESQSDLMSKGWKKFRELRAKETSADISVSDNSGYDIGDKISATDSVTGIEAQTTITSKNVKIANGIMTISFGVGAIG